LWGVAPSLRVLNMSANSIEDEDLASIVVLQQLTSLDLSSNSLMSTNVLSQLLFRLPRLQSLQLKGNPLTGKHKWREALIIAGESLEEIDGKTIAPHERAFLLRLAAKRSGALKPTPRQDAGGGRQGSGGRVNSGDVRRPATMNEPYELAGPDAVLCDAPPLLFGQRRPIPGSAGAGRFPNGVPQ